MQPNDNQNPSPDNRGHLTPPQRDPSAQHQAVAQMTRGQIDQLYEHQYSQPPSQEQATTQSTYARTHTPAHAVDQKEWQHYHSAWQEYYQKYYGHYYASAYQDAHTALKEHAVSLQQSAQQAAVSSPEEQTLDKNEAMGELRNQLLGKVQEGAKTVRKSRHFVPLISGFAVLILFVFIQYNSNIIAFAQAYTSPGDIDPQNIIADPNVSLAVDKAPRLIIPKINVDIGVDYNAKTDYNSQMAAMKNGVAYFGIPGANSKPGQFGNVPISGHSSNDFTDSGDAKFIFARLEQLKKGDIFYLNYKGTRYTYAITRTFVVKPSEVDSLQIGDDKPYATLITCTPLGTAQKRLIVVAEQISPSPSKATGAPVSSGESTDSAELAGKSPTLLERAFGAR